jgi:transcriptional regulator GlxA family with amidase domain
VVEPLRAANTLGAEPKYSWITVSDAKPVRASNGISIEPDYRPADDPTADYIVVCSGGDADQLTENSRSNGSART